MTVMLSRGFGVVALSTAVACQLVVGVESRSERSHDAADASTALVDSGSIADTGATNVKCTFGRVTCGSDCVDIQANEHHCGACGHECLGAACLRGECAPELLASVAYGQVSAVDDKDVFYRPAADTTAVGPLIARDKHSGATRTLTEVGQWQSGVVDGLDLVVLENAPAPTIRIVDRTSGASRTLYRQPTSAPFFRSVAVAGDDIYWTTRADVRHVKRDGSGYAVIKQITEGPHGADQIVVTDTEVFFSVVGRAELYSVPRLAAPGGVHVRGTGLGAVTSIMRVGSGLFWTSGPKMHVLADDGQVSDHFLDLRLVHSSARKDRYIYLYDVVFGDVHQSQIIRFDTTTNEKLVLASALLDGRLVVDDTHVYFANYIGGLYRIAR